MKSLFKNLMKKKDEKRSSEPKQPNIDAFGVFSLLPREIFLYMLELLMWGNLDHFSIAYLTFRFCIYNETSNFVEEFTRYHSEVTNMGGNSIAILK